MPKLTITRIIYAVLFVVLIGTAYNIYNAGLLPIKGASSGAPSKDPIVTVNLIKIENAQRLQMSNILAQGNTPSDYSYAFKATGDVVAAARKVAPNATIAVKQAFLYAEYPDITDAVIEELGLPDPGQASVSRNAFGISSQFDQPSDQDGLGTDSKNNVLPY